MHCGSGSCEVMSSATARRFGPHTILDYRQWIAHGLAHQRAGRPIDAMVCYRRALDANVNAVAAWYRLGEVLRELGCDDEARAAWRAALSLRPRYLPLIFD